MEEIAIIAGYLLSLFIHFHLIKKEIADQHNMTLKNIAIMLKAHKSDVFIPAMQNRKKIEKGSAFNPSQDLEMRMKGEIVEVFE